MRLEVVGRGRVDDADTGEGHALLAGEPVDARDEAVPERVRRAVEHPGVEQPATSVAATGP